MSNICDCCAGKSEQELIDDLVKTKSIEELKLARNQMKRFRKHIKVLGNLIEGISEKDMEAAELIAFTNKIEVPETYTPEGRSNAINYYKSSLHKADKGIRCLTEAIKISQSNTTQ